MNYRVFRFVNGKIEFTEKEFGQLLTEIFEEGYLAGCNKEPTNLMMWAPPLEEAGNVAKKAKESLELFEDSTRDSVKKYIENCQNPEIFNKLKEITADL